jgi:hypothetical protein
MPPDKYILKNITRYDVNIGDLGYRIPAGKSRNLLGKNARIKWEVIEKSIKSGSLFKRLGRSLVEVAQVIEALPPPKTVSKGEENIVFPQRTKSYIVIDVGEIDESVIKSEDDEFLRELEASNFEELPIVAKEDDET